MSSCWGRVEEDPQTHIFHIWAEALVIALGLYIFFRFIYLRAHTVGAVVGESRREELDQTMC